MSSDGGYKIPNERVVTLKSREWPGDKAKGVLYIRSCAKYSLDHTLNHILILCNIT